MSIPGRTNAINDGSVVSIGAASATVAAASPSRTTLWIKNTHATQTLSLSLGGTAVAGEGIHLAAGEGIVITGAEWKGAVNGIGSGAATTTAVAEV